MRVERKGVRHNNGRWERGEGNVVDGMQERILEWRVQI